MQYMLIYNETTEGFEQRENPETSDAYWAAWMAYIGEVREAGIIVSGEGLQTPATATQVRVRDGKREIQDGPYPETREHLGGYFVIDVPDLDAALQWAEKAPSSKTGHTEVRPTLPGPPAE